MLGLDDDNDVEVEVAIARIGAGIELALKALFEGKEHREAITSTKNTNTSELMVDV